MAKTFYYFSRLHPHFPDFFQVWKIAGQISRLFQELLKDYTNPDFNILKLV